MKLIDAAIAGARSRRSVSRSCTRSSSKLDAAAARPTVVVAASTISPHWPHVKNLVPHHSLYSFGRMQEVWLDR